MKSASGKRQKSIWSLTICSTECLPRFDKFNWKLIECCQSWRMVTNCLPIVYQSFTNCLTKFDKLNCQIQQNGLIWYNVCQRLAKSWPKQCGQNVARKTVRYTPYSQPRGLSHTIQAIRRSRVLWRAAALSACAAGIARRSSSRARSNWTWAVFFPKALTPSGGGSSDSKWRRVTFRKVILAQECCNVRKMLTPPSQHPHGSNEHPCELRSDAREREEIAHYEEYHDHSVIISSSYPKMGISS